MKRILPTVILVLVVLAGCLPAGSKYPPNKPFSPIVDVQYMDLSLITGVPCAAPCWHGLTVDKSTKKETLTVINSLAFVDPSSIHETESGYWDPSYKSGESVAAVEITANCKKPEGKECFLFEFVGNILKDIYYFPNYTMTLQDAVNYFGKPSCLTNFGWGAECLGCGIRLIYDTRQLSVSVLDKRCGEGAELCSAIRQGGKIPPDYVVDTIVYYSQAWVGYSMRECFAWPSFLSH